jgi:PAS domain S-box-containing protein
VHKPVVFRFGLLLTVLAVSAGLTAWSVHRLRANDARVAHAHLVLERIESVLSLVKDAETGQRGFLLTHDQQYLSPYRQALDPGPDGLTSTLDDLRRETADGGTRRALLDALENQARWKLDELARTVRLGEAGHWDEAVNLVREGHGRRVMDDLRRIAADMRQEEERLLGVRQRESQASAGLAYLTIALGAAVALALGAAAFRLTLTDQARQRRAEEDARRIVTILESITDATFAVDHNWRFIYVNSRWEQQFRRRRDEVVGRNLWEVFPRDLGTVLEETYRRVVREQAQATIEILSPYAERWVEVRAFPGDDGLVTYIHDIDDRKRAEIALQQERDELEARVRARTADLMAANERLTAEVEERRRAEERVSQLNTELQRSNGELQQFATVASHDLQEPLRKIQAFGDRLRLRSADQLGDQGRDYLERMQNAAARMSTLINDLLAFARVTTRAQPFVPVDLATVAREVVGDLEGRLQHSGGRVELGDLPQVVADPLQMRQLLQNLIGNALKFRRPDVPPVVQVFGRLSEEAPQPGSNGEARTWCELLVSDNGIGFEEKYLDRIFDVFQRLHSRSEYEGTGMGLAISRKIVERHGGRITARSTPGHGATFVVSLPVPPPERSDIP